MLLDHLGWGQGKGIQGDQSRSHYLDKASLKYIILLPPFSLCCEFLEPTFTKKRLRKYNTVLGSQKSPEYHQRLQFTSYSVSPIAHVSKCIQYEQQDIGKSTFCWLPRGAFYPGHMASTTAFSWGSYCFNNCLAFFVLITSTVSCQMTWDLSDVFLMVRSSKAMGFREMKGYPPHFCFKQMCGSIYNSHGLGACLHLIWSISNIFPFY